MSKRKQHSPEFKAKVALEALKDAKIGELAVANDFLSRKLKPWGVK